MKHVQLWREGSTRQTKEALLRFCLFFFFSLSVFLCFDLCKHCERPYLKKKKKLFCLKVPYFKNKQSTHLHKGAVRSGALASNIRHLLQCAVKFE